MQPLITEKEYEIHYHETDFRRKVWIYRLMNYFDDIVLEQSNLIGFGLDFFEKNSLIWVLLNWDIKIIKLPSYQDKVLVRTFPYSMKKCYGYRKYEIRNSIGENIVTADTAWIFLDRNTMRPLRVPENICTAYGIVKDEGESLAMDKINSPDRDDMEKDFFVRYSDIDGNQHVNNVSYVEWALETVPMDLLLNYDPLNIKISYKKESKYGDAVRSISEININGSSADCRHKITDKNGVDLCLLQTIWEKSA